MFPGDEEMERRIRRLIRWNAVAMVLRANNRYNGIGGHLATYARRRPCTRSASTTSSGARTRAAAATRSSTRVTPHPACYARAFLEGRLSVEQLDHFRRETGGSGLIYPHPRLMPDFWEFPTVSMGLGPIARSTRPVTTAICQPRPARHVGLARLGVPR